MIKNLSVSNGLMIDTIKSRPYILNSSPHSGMVHYNTNTNELEVNAGSHWVSLEESVSIGLSPDAAEAIAWCKKKMQEELELHRLMDRHPGLKDAYDKFNTMKALCIDVQDTTR